MKFTKFGKALLVSALSVGVILGVASCVESYTVGFLYVTGTMTAQPNGPGIISGFKIDHNTGKLTTINGLPISSGGANPIRATLLTGSKYLYVLNRGVNSAGNADCTTEDPCKNSNVVQFSVGGNGILTPQETFFSQGVNPSRILSDTSGNFVFVLDHDAPSNVGCKQALGANVTTCGDITVFQVNQNTGRLQLVINAQVTSAQGQPLTYFPVPADPIDFVMSSGFVLTLSGTSTTGDVVFPYTYSTVNGQLTVNQNGTQPLNIKEGNAIVNGSGNIYVLDNEKVTATEPGGTKVTSLSQILPYSVGTNGFLQPEPSGAVPDDPTQANPTQLLVESKGKFIYVANQGDNDTQSGNAQSGIAGYILNSPFQLVFIPGEPFGSGAGPQCIVEDPSNQYIYTANYNDSTVTGSALNVETGTLQDLAKGSSFALTGPATWCVINGRTD